MCIVFDLRNYLLIFEFWINDKNFESVYVKGGINVKLLVVENKDEENVGKE